MGEAVLYPNKPGPPGEEGEQGIPGPDDPAIDRVLAQCFDNDNAAQAVMMPDTNWAAIDAVRLEPVTFTPETSEVMVEFEMFVQGERTTGNVVGYFGALAAGVLVPGSAVAMIGSNDNGIMIQGHLIARVGVAVVPGVPLTWTWGHMKTGLGFVQCVWGGKTSATPFGRARMRIIQEAVPF